MRRNIIRLTRVSLLVVLAAVLSSCEEPRVYGSVSYSSYSGGGYYHGGRYHGGSGFGTSVTVGGRIY